MCNHVADLRDHIFIFNLFSKPPYVKLQLRHNTLHNRWAKIQELDAKPMRRRKSWIQNFGKVMTKSIISYTQINTNYFQKHIQGNEDENLTKIVQREFNSIIFSGKSCNTGCVEVQHVAVIRLLVTTQWEPAKNVLIESLLLRCREA